MNPCCEHLFREAKREIEIRDKRIIELQNECTRLFEPTRSFWNMDTQTRIEALIKENELYTDKIFELEEKLSKSSDCLKKIANQDFRGNRPHETIWAHECLKEIGER
jgi:hypothetical protein